MGDSGSSGRVYRQSSDADVCGITMFLALKEALQAILAQLCCSKNYYILEVRHQSFPEVCWHASDIHFHVLSLLSKVCHFMMMH
jgi:hypothetical protein